MSISIPAIKLDFMTKICIVKKRTRSIVIDIEIVLALLTKESYWSIFKKELHTGSTLENSSPGLPLLEPAIPTGSGPTPSSSIEFRYLSINLP